MDSLVRPEKKTVIDPEGRTFDSTCDFEMDGWVEVGEYVIYFFKIYNNYSNFILGNTIIFFLPTDKEKKKLNVKYLRNATKQRHRYLLIIEK